MSAIAISVVTEAELLYGLPRRGHPAALSERVRQFLLRVGVRDWDRRAADAYAALRADRESRSVSLAPLDTMVAAHAIAEDAVLVTRDKAFTPVEGRLRVEDWTSA